MKSRKAKPFQSADPILEFFVNEIIQKHKCHTVIVYGSRARGDETAKSDYDLMGVRLTGKKKRLAQIHQGKYLDAVVVPEKDLKKLGEDHFNMKHAKVLFQKGQYGTQFLARLEKAMAKPYQPMSEEELNVIRVWISKMIERIENDDIESRYRRTWLQETLLVDYFNLRKVRFWGSKEAFAWLKKNDPQTYKLYNLMLEDPTNFKILKRLVQRVVV